MFAEQNAEVAELADAQASGACGSNTVRVQVPLSALFYLSRKRLSLIEAGVFFAIKQKVESCKDNPGMIY